MTFHVMDRLKVKFTGSIELKEMIEIIGTLYEMEGVPKVIKTN